MILPIPEIPHSNFFLKLVSQYFAKLLNVHEEEDQKLIYAEGSDEENAALDLLVSSP